MCVYIYIYIYIYIHTYLSLYTVRGRNIAVTHLRYSANHNALDSWPIRAHLASQNDELCKNRRISERRSIERQQ